MKKYYLLYCTVLYCSIDVLGCDCCKKLCVKKKSGEEDVQKEKSVVEKKTEWEFFKKYSTPKERANAWETTLSTFYLRDYDVVVPVVFEQHDKKKGCVWDEAGEAKMFAIQKNFNVQTMYNTIFQGTKLKSLVLYFNGDTNLSYDGADTPLGKKSISDDSLLFNKESDDPILKRAVFISYYAEMDNNNIFV